MTRKLIIAGAALAAVVAVSGCARQSNAAGTAGITPVNQAPAASPSAAASAVPPATPSAPATTHPAVPKTAPANPPAASAGKTASAPKPCLVAQIGVKDAGNQGAAGTLVEKFLLTNTSGQTCTMNKYPFISPYGLMSQGSSKVEANFDTKIDPIPSGFGDLGAVGGLQTLKPGGTAVFFLKWSQVPTGDDPCPQADGFDFRPPQDTSGNKLVPFSFTPCGGEAQVSQVMSPSVTE